MKANRLKKPIIVGVSTFALLTFFGGMFMIDKQFFKENEYDNYDYVSRTIFDKGIPVVSTASKIIRPYTNAEIKILKDFYDYKAESEKQQNSILYYESTYLQNSGISYGGVEENFDVVAILDGTVTSVKEDKTLGKIVEIRHSNDIVSVYQSLGEINVKVDDQVKQGTVIGNSGTSNISKDLNNHLHFELIIKGLTVNPEEYYDKKVDEL